MRIAEGMRDEKLLLALKQYKKCFVFSFESVLFVVKNYACSNYAELCVFTGHNSTELI